MGVTDVDITGIPPGNLRVPRADFVALWTAAERRSSESGDHGVTGWEAGGVAQTCAWMATAPLRFRNGTVIPARSPVTRRASLAYEEVIEAELVAAERLAMRSPRPMWVGNRPGWIEAVCATLRWAWHHEGPMPLPELVRAAR